MLNKTAAFFIICQGMFIFAGSASAVPITFDFSGGGPNGASIPFQSGGAELTVTAARLNNTPEIVTWNNNGLGVRVNNTDNGQLDSNGPNEQLIFTISGLPAGVGGLRLEQIDFAGFSLALEDFGLRIDGANPLGNNFSPPTDPWLVAQNIPNDIDRTFLSEFTVRVNDGGQAPTADAFRITSVTVATVPEPGTLMLLTLGVAGLFILTRRTKRAHVVRIS